VFLNLLSNALKFSRLNEKSIVEIGEMLMEGAPVIFVRDHGVGFDPRQADKMFQVFQRFHSDDEFEGTGVGLAIVQRIIQKHGGSIWAESEPRKGATFYFSIGREMSSGTRKPGTMESLTEKSR
jgi:light-regulated signal transduction histidine kinase (bacteriophytochrome)